MKLILTDRKPEAPDTISLVFKPQNPLNWRAGQFLVYTLPHPSMDDRKDERYFTISSAPNEGYIMLTTRFAEKSSTFKKTLKNLPVGGTVDVSAPDGDFTAVDPAAEMVFIAGGIGITPYRAILADMQSRNLPIHATLLYANRDENFVYRNELETIAAKNPGFKINYFVSPNRVNEEAIRKAAPDLTKPIFYVSGPEPMVESFQKTLSGMGISETHIKTDFFPGYDWP